MFSEISLKKKNLGNINLCYRDFSYAISLRHQFPDFLVDLHQLLRFQKLDI